MPDKAIGAEWELFKRAVLSDDTSIPPKYKELIGVAVAAAMACWFIPYTLLSFLTGFIIEKIAAKKAANTPKETSPVIILCPAIHIIAATHPTATHSVRGLTIFILFTYDGFERVLVFDKKMIIRK